jgi:DNA-binding CsgD family transcriptional regulator
MYHPGHPVLTEPVLPASKAAKSVFRQLQQLWTREKDCELDNMEAILATLPALDTISEAGHQYYALIDMLTQKYLYLSPNINQLIGKEISDTYAGGMAWLFERIHPDDLEPLVEINKVKWDFYRSLSEEERVHFRANFDFRMRHESGRYRRLQQQSICLRHTPSGDPHLMLAQLVEITHLKPPVPEEKEQPFLLLTIHTGGPDQVVLRIGPQENVLWKRPLLSTRELQILKLLDIGLSSRAIAEELGSSSATIDTQRRGMLRKTGVVDTTALVSYGQLLGWI